MSNPDGAPGAASGSPFRAAYATAHEQALAKALAARGVDEPDVTASPSQGTTPDSPWIELPRAKWSQLAHDPHIALDQATVERLRSRQDPTDERDVEEVYLPLAQLISLRLKNRGRLFSAQNDFLQLDAERTPLIVGVAGSVAVGKSTAARLLQELLSRDAAHPNVALVPTDGFLYPTAELERLGLLARKGFPESYDRRALLKFVVDVKSGCPDLSVPVYSQVLYDIVPGELNRIHNPDIVILEGLNVLQPAVVGPDGHTGLTVGDFMDFSVFVDADEADIERWFVERAVAFRASADDPDSFFKTYAGLSDEEYRSEARKVWEAINGPNLRDNIAPTKPRATAILRKGSDHRIESVRIRKI